MKRLRIDYMLAAGDPQRRYAINREFIALAFEMKAAGASRAGIARRASAILVTTVAVSSADCTCAWSRIEHRDSGRSISFRIWTDFA